MDRRRFIDGRAIVAAMRRPRGFGDVGVFVAIACAGFMWLFGVCAGMSFERDSHDNLREAVRDTKAELVKERVTVDALLDRIVKTDRVVGEQYADLVSCGDALSASVAALDRCGLEACACWQPEQP